MIAPGVGGLEQFQQEREPVVRPELLLRAGGQPPVFSTVTARRFCAQQLS